jgi:phosphoadenosine phosphosulfate reductase
MSIYQLNIEGKNKIETAIERIKFFAPIAERTGGYYVAYSGGKDSTVIKALTKMARVKYDAHYNTTTVDPPELVQFIKTQSDVKREFPELTMWELIPKKLIPPTRLARYCCSYLKESGGAGRFVMTGVRWAESSKRKNNRSMIEFDRYGSQSKEATRRRQEFLMSDNNAKRRMLETATSRGGVRSQESISLTQ